MAKRTDVSLIQLGYRLTIGKKSIPLIDFSRSPFLGQGATEFPSGTFEFNYEDEERVYDVYQQRPLGAAEEDEFEANGTVTGTPRLFLNERIGRVSLSGSVTFEHDPNDQGFTGEAVVTIRTVDPEHFPDAAILHVSVLETLCQWRGRRAVEDLADDMTIHLVPSYLTLGAEFFDDYAKAFAAMLRVIPGLDDKYGLNDLRIPVAPDPDPKWGVRRGVSKLLPRWTRLIGSRPITPKF